MKTVLQELITRLQESAKEFEKDGEGLYASALLNSAALGMHFLEKEKQQIVAAYTQGRKEEFLDWYPEKQGEEYYNETYGGKS